jgi:hypothetical protein
MNEGIRVKNGNDFNQSSNNVCGLIEQIINRDGEDNPQPFKVTVPVIDSGHGGGGGGACNDKLGNVHNIVGYTTLEIFGVSCKKNELLLAPGAPDPKACDDPQVPSGKYIVGALRCDGEPQGLGGGGNFGLQARFMRLVR